MALTKDIILDDKYTIHIGLFPSLGLLIVNDRQDFAENWIESTATQESRSRVDITTKTLSGHQDADLVEGVSSYFLQRLLNEIQSPSSDREPNFIGPSLSKLIINLNLRREIMSNQQYIKSIGTELVSLLN